MNRIVAFLTVLALVVASGTVSGLWTNRWGTAVSAEQAGARLEQVPLSVGEWDGTDVPLTDREVKAAQFSGYLHRRYLHRKSGQVVTVLVACGRGGPMCVHTPDVCYTNSGYQQTATKAFALDDQTAFKVLEFRRTNVAMSTQMRLYLAWGTRGGWAAPTNPRLSYAGQPVLYKVYASREVTKLQEDVEHDPSADLLKALMPELNRTLFGDS